MRTNDALRRLRELGDPAFVERMAGFGIVGKTVVGARTPDIKRMAKEIGTDRALAAALWRSEVLEARFLASMIEDPAAISEAQADRWAADVDSWAICDCLAFYLFRKTPFAWSKAVEWTRSKHEGVKRSAFALMAALAIHDKAAADARFVRLLKLVERESDDDRHLVRKGVNWALRNIGKRNAALNAAAIAAGGRIRARGTKAARWIAADALRELRSPAVRARLAAKARAK